MSENTKENVKMVQKECENCGGEVSHVDFGLTPRQVITDAPEFAGWIRAYGCRYCGSFTLESPTDEELEQAFDEVVDFFDRNDIVEPEEVEQMRR